MMELSCEMHGQCQCEFDNVLVTIIIKIFFNSILHYCI